MSGNQASNSTVSVNTHNDDASRLIYQSMLNDPRYYFARPSSDNNQVNSAASTAPATTTISSLASASSSSSSRPSAQAKKLFLEIIEVNKPFEAQKLLKKRFGLLESKTKAGPGDVYSAHFQAIRDHYPENTVQAQLKRRIALQAILSQPVEKIRNFFTLDQVNQAEVGQPQEKLSETGAQFLEPISDDLLCSLVELNRSLNSKKINLQEGQDPELPRKHLAKILRIQPPASQNTASSLNLSSSECVELARIYNAALNQAFNWQEVCLLTLTQGKQEQAEEDLQALVNTASEIVQAALRAYYKNLQARKAEPFYNFLDQNWVTVLRVAAATTLLVLLAKLFPALFLGPLLKLGFPLALIILAGMGFLGFALLETFLKLMERSSPQKHPLVLAMPELVSKINQSSLVFKSNRAQTEVRLNADPSLQTFLQNNPGVQKYFGALPSKRWLSFFDSKFAYCAAAFITLLASTLCLASPGQLLSGPLAAAVLASFSLQSVLVSCTLVLFIFISSLILADLSTYSYSNLFFTYPEPIQRVHSRELNPRQTRQFNTGLGPDSSSEKNETKREDRRDTPSPYTQLS